MEYDDAFKILAKHFFMNNGIIEAMDINYEPTDRELKAIDYLFHEYDYIYKAW